MRVDNVSFQANIPKSLNEKLFDVALNKTDAEFKQFRQQVKNIKNWGLESTELAEYQRKDKNSLLILVNNYFAPLKRVLLPQKGNLYDTFMSLTERDIKNAEDFLKI